MTAINIRELQPADYDSIIALWQTTPGIGLSEADSKENLSTFLARNNGLSFGAETGHEIIGTILCGHDGRRGFLYHLAVDSRYRCRGIGRSLVEHSLAKLEKLSIKKCHLFVLTDNSQGQDFWSHIGFRKREDIHICSRDIY